MQFARVFQSILYTFSVVAHGDKLVTVYSGERPLDAVQVTATVTETYAEPLEFLAQSAHATEGVFVAVFRRVRDGELHPMLCRLAQSWTYLARAVGDFNRAIEEADRQFDAGDASPSTSDADALAETLMVKIEEYNRALGEAQAFAERQYAAGRGVWHDAMDVWTKFNADMLFDVDLERMTMPEFVLHRFVRAALASRVEVQVILCSATLEGDFRVEETRLADSPDHAVALARSLAAQEKHSVDVTRRMVYLPGTGMSFWFDGKEVRSA